MRFVLTRLTAGVRRGLSTLAVLLLGPRHRPPRQLPIRLQSPARVTSVNPIHLSDPRKRVVLHIGVHKTGSTSIQEFLRSHRSTLQWLGIDFYEGAYSPRNHVELHAAAMRPQRDSPFKLNRGLQVDADFRRAVKERVREFVEGSACPCIVFSAEGLSYLRHEDELERLREMFSTESVEIIMYVRDPHRFLESYTRELTKHARPGVIDMDSFAYIEPDTWLVDFKSRVSAYRQAFGPQSVMVLDYDIETRESGNVIPSFLRTLGIEEHFRSEELAEYFLRRSDVRETPDAR